MAKATVVTTEQIAADLLASIRKPVAESESTPVIDFLADKSSGFLNGLTRIGGALRAAGHTAVDHYKLEKTDQLDRAEFSLKKRAEEVAARMLARRQ